MAENLAKKSPEGAEVIYRHLLADAKNSNDIPDVVLCNIYEKYGDFAFDHSRFEDALTLWKRGEEWAKKIGHANFESGFMQREGFGQHFLFEQSEGDAPNPESALRALQLRPNEANHPTHHRANCFRNLGLAYMDRGDYAEADEYLQKAISDYESANVSDYTFDLKSYRVENLVKQKKFAEANKLFLAILSTLKTDDLKGQLKGNYVDYLRFSEPQIKEIFARVRTSFKASNFADLDAYAQTLTSEATIMPSGLWALDEFYDALNNLNEGALNAVWERRIEKFKEWKKANPDSSTAQVALAKCLTRYAWKARGSGWADTVTEEGWRSFRDRLQQASAILDQVKHKNPNWYRASQVVALGQGWDRDKYDGLVAECRKRYPTYYTPIFVKAYWILPKWHGDPGELEKYSEQQSRAISGQDGGDVLYARIAWSLTNRALAVVSDEHMTWPKIRSGLKSIIKRFPSSPIVPGILSIIAMEYGDEKAAQAAFTD
jgi:tetratricopeptide (TPR) repeat protein